MNRKAQAEDMVEFIIVVGFLILLSIGFKACETSSADEVSLLVEGHHTDVEANELLREFMNFEYKENFNNADLLIECIEKDDFSEFRENAAEFFKATKLDTQGGCWRFAILTQDENEIFQIVSESSISCDDDKYSEILIPGYDENILVRLYKGTEHELPKLKAI